MARLKKQEGNPIALIDTTGMDNDVWLKVREHGKGYDDPLSPDYLPFTITGSGASSALGVNPWVSDLEYADKKMGINTKLEAEFNEESKAAGHVFEPFVAINFVRHMKQEFSGIKIKVLKDVLRDIVPYLDAFCPDKESYDLYQKSQDDLIKHFNKKWKLNPSYMYQCGIKDADGNLKYPFALANIDGLVEINGKLGIFEAKTTSSSNPSVREYWQKGKIPPYYYWQVVFYMAVMNVEFTYITCIWGVTLKDMAVIYLERDRDVEEKFMDFLKEFVENMELGIAIDESKSDPELVNQYYYRLYGPAEKKARSVELPSYCKKMVANALELDRQEAELKKQIAEIGKEKAKIYNDFYPIMQDNAYATIQMDEKTKYGIKLKPSMKRAVFDEKGFKKEYPELFEEYSQTVVDTTKLTKKYKDIKEKYTKPPVPNPTGTPSFELYEYEQK